MPHGSSLSRVPTSGPIAAMPSMPSDPKSVTLGHVDELVPD
jgi:hypothetical protein